MKARILLFLVLTAFLTTGCVELVEKQQGESSQPVGEIHGPRTVGQTLVAYHDGLKGIEVLLATYARQNTQPLIFHLRSTPSSDFDIATVTVSALDVKDNAFHRFNFPPIPDSHSRRYYFFIESPTSKPGDAITAWRGPADAYLEGALYLDGGSREGQLVFKLVYDPLYIIMGLVRGFVLSLPAAIVATLLFVLPGLSLLIWLLPDEARTDWTTRILLSAGMSVALFPLILLYARLAGGVRLGPIWLWGGLLFCGGLTALGICRKRTRIPRIGPPSLETVALGILAILTLAVRFIVVRSLSVPMWGDSYQHTMIAQLIVDNGGLFSSWEPYVPLDMFTYHFGFHAAVAFYHWLTGTDVIRSVIVVGQVLNVLAVFMLFPLTVKLTKSRWAGVIAVLVGGLLSPMPMYYVNWGRYTQLAGQVILPLTMIFTLEVVERRGRNYKLLALATISLAGLALTHYRIVLFYLCFLLPIFVSQVYQRKRDKAEVFLRIASIVLSALAVVSPWVWNTFSGPLPRVYSKSLANFRPTKFLQEYNAMGDVSFFIDYYLIALSALGGIWGLINRKKGVIFVIIWVALLFLMANPYALRLPGTGVVNNFAVLISLYIPASVLSGYLFGRVVDRAQARWPSVGYIAGFLLLIIALVGAKSRLSVVNPYHVLVTKADEEAMAWIRENIPHDAKFLTNFFFAYGDSLIVGSDAGWWIPLLTGRKNTTPPINYASEGSLDPDYRFEINEFARKIQNSNPSEAFSLLRENGITHVYIGQKGGDLPVEEFLQSCYYRVVYHQNRVWIFETNP